ncbi:MAG: lipopolysaccharide biosynthesis protein [Muribaculaceae bacterium]|nr:lipopolysaccharide biosynthesis protein [Muribaculaceae bacterium]
MDTQASNRHIAKNTLYLYLRMVVTIIVNLIAVRMLWRALGVDDYGIYSLVGGLVWLFTFLSATMVSATQRYMSYELGRGDMEMLRKVFSISMKVHYGLALLLIVLAEAVGIWLINCRLNIPADRLVAANWVYQCSLGAFVMTLLSVPYNASLVAHEKMNVYGYLGILEVVLKLVIIFITDWIPFDRLITYSVLLFTVTLLMRVISALYCKRHFEECSVGRYSDKALRNELIGFGKWTMLGVLGFSFRDYGMGILLNLFFNVAVNAARGMAYQVGNVISGFASNFTMAMNPQITKRYAMGEIGEMMKLVFAGSKYALLLMGMVVVPLTVEMELVLRLWLGDIAPYVVGFTRLALLLALVECVTSPVVTAIQATGNIRLFQILISILMLSTFPLAWVWLKCGGSPYTVYYVSIGCSVIGIWMRIWLLRREIEFSSIRYFTTVYARSVPAILVAAVATWWISRYFADNFFGLAAFAVAAVALYVAVVYVIALNRSERAFVIDKAKGIIKKFSRH